MTHPFAFRIAAIAIFAILTFGYLEAAVQTNLWTKWILATFCAMATLHFMRVIP